MSRGSLRLGMSNRDERREPGVGRHLGLFHMVKVDKTGGRNVSVGRLSFDRLDLEPFREQGLRLRVTVVGLLRLSDDVSPALATAVLDAKVIGWIKAHPATKAALLD